MGYVTGGGTSSSGGAVSTVAGRTGDVVLTAADVGAGQLPTGVLLPSGVAVPSGADISGVLGTSSSKAAAGNDSRLSDARTPSAHKTSHATGGSDALAVTDILPSGSTAGQELVWNGTTWIAATPPANLGNVVNGYLAESFPLESAWSATVFASGTIYGVRVPLPYSTTFTTVDVCISTAGSTLTSGQSLCAVYDSTGTQIGSTSADQSSAWTGTGVIAMTVGAPAAQTGSIYVLLLSVGTTPPTFRCGHRDLLNAHISTPSASLRCFTLGASNTGQTTLPGSFTASAIRSTSATVIPFWCGLR